MNITMGNRIDAAAEAALFTLHMSVVENVPDATYRLRHQLKNDDIDRDVIIDVLRKCCGLPTAAYRRPSDLASVMFHAARVETFLDLPPGSHGRPGFGGLDPCDLMLYFDVAEAEFAALEKVGEPA